MFFKKFLYMYMDNNIFENITIFAKDIDDNSKYILDKVKEEYNSIKIKY